MKAIFILNAADCTIAGVIAVVIICVVMRPVQQKRICITQAVAAVLLSTYLFLIFCSTVIARPNMGMLVPVGFLLPLLSRRIKCRHVIFAAFLISYTIEFSQLIFCKGLFELVDDPFHNVLGAIVGYGIYRVARRKNSY